MPKNKLTDREVRSLAKQSGKHGDGGGLYLTVSGEGRARWIYLFRLGGRSREMGLGSVSDTSLAAARDARDDAERLVKAGVDPIDEKKKVKIAELVTAKSFGEFADELIKDIAPGFRNSKHIDQWKMTLSDAYCKTIRTKPIAEVDTADVLAVLKSVWVKKQETASRIRGRIERVLDAAKAKGLREGENPARWKGHLDALLPKPQKLARGHHAAMPYADLPEFWKELLKLDSVSASALAFTILTAARSGETLGALWSEIDFVTCVWTVPAARMKGGREHRVPLTEAALTILKEVKKLKRAKGSEEIVFPGAKAGRPLSGMALAMCLRGISDKVTVHGFRSSFRDWVSEETSFAREFAEAALAHVYGDSTERAYRRGDALEKRRLLMKSWADFASGSGGGNIVLLAG